MKLYEFLESRYVIVNIENNKEYSTFKHAETLATHDLINAQRKLFKFIAYFKLLGLFFAVRFGLIEKPKDIKQMKEEEMETKKKAAEERKVAIAATQEQSSDGLEMPVITQ